ncbi:MAG: pyroglutamyl-peptidase I [Deltaproteobacteria bacterium]|nr:pyroglutamyl-peptidase I [Deltaproteobacteria bacterium]|tara:strand:- start:2314 stop:2928 length:615 start_codon:yes stop_codon:yes gene_type:complete
MRSVSLIGFKPFAHYHINPSQELVRYFSTIAPHSLHTLILPVQQDGLFQTVSEHIQTHKPDAVIGIGQAPGGTIRLERVGLNVADFRIPDTAGAQPSAQPLIEGAPDAYFSNLPLQGLQQRLLDASIPTTISDSAGTYLCNQLLFTIRHIQKEHTPEAIGGFIHVPLLPSQAAEHISSKRPGPAPASMSLETMREALQHVIEYV